MAELWRTSKWVRLHDWDWIAGPHIPLQEDWSSKRATVVPPKFFYHVLRVADIKQQRLETFSGPVRVVEHDDIYEHILRFYSTPRPFAAILQEFRSQDYPRDEWANLTDRMRLLRETRMLVPDGDDEATDCHAVFKAALFLFGIWQLEEEFAPALQAVAEMRPRAVVEIGTGWGGSLFSLAQVADPEAHLVSVDLPGGIGGGGSENGWGSGAKGLGGR